MREDEAKRRGKGRGRAEGEGEGKGPKGCVRMQKILSHRITRRKQRLWWLSPKT